MVLRQSVPPPNAINLDDQSIEDLKRLRRSKRLSSSQRTYALIKISAMRARLRGDITSALLSERECDRIYADLPYSDRW